MLLKKVLLPFKKWHGPRFGQEKSTRISDEALLVTLYFYSHFKSGRATVTSLKSMTADTASVRSE